MNAAPPGWGFAPAVDVAVSRAARIERQTAAMHAPAIVAKRRASRARVMRGRDRELHFRFVIWVLDFEHTTGDSPRIRDVTQAFGINPNTASKYLRDVRRAIRHPLEKP